ncbi:hypothetical protein BIV59_16845 [Bacillus sp. MUM 13]|nr:hypothetical protein BIV59_16845 [Bacillus sp. MUM 13]
MLKQDKLYLLEKEFKNMFRTMRKELSVIYGESINSSEFLVLKNIAFSEIKNATGLSKEMDVSASHITTVTESLVKKGLILRKRTESDRRVVTFDLTEEGVNLINNLEKKKTEYLHEKFGTFTEDELTSLLHLIKKFK